MTIPIAQFIAMPESKTLDFDAATDYFERHRKRVKNDLESLRLVARHKPHLVPTVGGMLLFGKNREMVFPDA